MLKSMYSGIAGMKANQTKLDVIGNNISNVGTTSFKASTVKFQDMLSQNISDATAPTATQGGLNSQQVGLGVQLSSIDTVMTQGTLSPTGRPLDLAIDGESQFFMVSKGAEIYGDSTLQVTHRAGSHGITDQSLASSGSEMMYTRDGSFILDQQGNLLTSKGYRVLGYTVTNDDNGTDPTSISPSNLSAMGMDFKLGPGTQLNGYKVALGTISAGTATSADVDKESKTIVLSGDFTTDSNLTAEQVTNALNKGLSAAGISQQISAFNTPSKISSVNTESISGGSDATAPSTVSLMGVTFKFTEGSDLNDYTIKVGNISATATKANVDTTDKTITIDGDFINKGGLTSDDMENAVNLALKSAKITQTVKATGIVSQFSQLMATSDNTGTIAVAPKTTASAVATVPIMAAQAFGTPTFNIGFKLATTADNTVARPVTANGEKGAQLNGYTFVLAENTSVNSNSFAIDKDSKKITVTVGTSTATGTVTVSGIETSLNDFLYDSGLKDVRVDKFNASFTKGSGNGSVKISPDATNGATLGTDLTTPKSVTVGGMTINLPKGTIFNNVQVQIDNIDGPLAGKDPVEFEYSGTAPNQTVTKMHIRGDFRNQFITSSTLQTNINNAILKAATAAGGNHIYGTVTPAPTTVTDLENKGLATTVSGAAKAITGLESNTLAGGAELKAPQQPKTVFGMNFTLGMGAALNGYKITVGQVTAGTQTSAKIDSTSKTITINGDFTSGTLTARNVKSALDAALRDKGIDQSILVSGTPTTLTGTYTGDAAGGTSVESLDSDGNVFFVDGGKKPKAYDGTLKSLKIPDKIKIAGTDTELKVKSFSIDSSGIINCALEDGSTAAVGQIALAGFKNPEGLKKLGGNLYTKSANSGDAIVRSGLETKGDDNSKGYGQMLGGMLELSNVDLAAQFTDMITATRSFQAASKTINTGDEILQEIINLKR